MQTLLFGNGRSAGLSAHALSDGLKSPCRFSLRNAGGSVLEGCCWSEKWLLYHISDTLSNLGNPLRQVRTTFRILFGFRDRKRAPSTGPVALQIAEYSRLDTAYGLR